MFSKKSFSSEIFVNRDLSIYSTDRLDSSSNLTIDTRLRYPRGHLLSKDFLQSSPNFIYPNLRIKSTGYKPRNEHLMFIFHNKSPSKNRTPLIYLGSEYFLRKSIDFDRVKYPISSNEHLEPLIDIFENRRQFVQEVPDLTDLSIYRSLPESISGLPFLDPSQRHTCSDFHQNRFTLDNLSRMSQRENHIIQTNATNDRRFRNLFEYLNNIYFYESEKNIPTKKSSHLRMNPSLPSIVTSFL